MSFDESSSNKRTRASGEVLDYLLSEFDHNHNPSPEQRKEISDRTNMSEKAVRIWFQNRRAKLRKLERMGRSGTGSIHSSRSNSISIHDLNMSPTGLNGQINNTNNNTNTNTNTNTNNTNNTFTQQNSSFFFGLGSIPIEINEKYCLVDCSSLSVGSWQRIKSGYHDENLLKNSLVNLAPFTLNTVMSNVDLLVILSKKNLELNYFFSAISNNLKVLFRIFYPISSIVTCSLLDNNINKENNELRVSLSHQPKFSVYFFSGANAESNQWSICEDFSEGQQVSSAYCNEGGSSIPHVLVGVKNSLQFLNAFILENNQLSHDTSNFHIPDGTNGGDDAVTFPDDDLPWNGNTLHQTSSIHSRGNGYSPMGEFDSETSPNSMTSMNSKTSTTIGPLLPNEIKTSSGGGSISHEHGNDHQDTNSVIHNNLNHLSKQQDHQHNNNNSNSSQHGGAGAGAGAGGSGGGPHDPYNESFNANTPDFFTATGAQTPAGLSSMHNNDINGSGYNNNTENLIHSPSTNLQAYTHQTHSPFPSIDKDGKHNYGMSLVGQGDHDHVQDGEPDHEDHEMVDEPFIDLHGVSQVGGTNNSNSTPQSHTDFEFTLSNEFVSHTPNSEANATSHGGHQVDSFIDYNNNYP
ncbi:hypothetical protein CAAN3_06S05072 [[Candida] anglica]